MADSSREEIRAKRERLAQLRRENAEKQKELVEANDNERVEKYSKSLDVEIAYEEWASNVLNGGSGEPPALQEQLTPPNNASLEDPLSNPLIPTELGNTEDDTEKEGE